MRTMQCTILQQACTGTIHEDHWCSTPASLNATLSVARSQVAATLLSFLDVQHYLQLVLKAWNCCACNTFPCAAQASGHPFPSESVPPQSFWQLSPCQSLFDCLESCLLLSYKLTLDRHAWTGLLVRPTQHTRRYCS